MRCIRCGSDIRIVLDGEEWCEKCQRYQRPRSHGWSAGAADLEADAEKDGGDGGLGSGDWLERRMWGDKYGNY